MRKVSNGKQNIKKFGSSWRSRLVAEDEIPAVVYRTFALAARSA